jgi:hypothetical protein
MFGINKQMPALLLALATAWAAPLSAEVIFDLEAGDGFIGRGDVLSNAGPVALLDPAPHVYVGAWVECQITWSQDDIGITSRKEKTSNPKALENSNENSRHHRGFQTSQEGGGGSFEGWLFIADDVDVQVRSNKKGHVTGYNLLGYLGTPNVGLLQVGDLLWMEGELLTITGIDFQAWDPAELYFNYSVPVDDTENMDGIIIFPLEN